MNSVVLPLQDRKHCLLLIRFRLINIYFPLQAIENYKHMLFLFSYEYLGTCLEQTLNLLSTSSADSVVKVTDFLFYSNIYLGQILCSSSASFSILRHVCPLFFPLIQCILKRGVNTCIKGSVSFDVVFKQRYSCL